jgi:hypothetical protein
MICLGESEYFRYNNPDEENCKYLEEEESNEIIHELASKNNVKEDFLNKISKTKLCGSLKSGNDRRMVELNSKLMKMR